MAPASHHASIRSAGQVARRAALLAALAVGACGGGGGSDAASGGSVVISPPAAPPSSPASPPSSPPVSPPASPPASPPVSPPASPPASPPISPPAAGLTGWEWILQVAGLPATPPKVAYLDVDGATTSASYVAAAKAQGSKTICYISVGTAETFRADFSQFRSLGVVGNSFPGFEEDKYLNINRYLDFIHLMDARLRDCQSKGFDYVEFDVMDTYQESAGTTGFAKVSEATQIAYVTELARRANGYGMQAVQKNADDLSARLQPIFGAVLFEECVRLRFCNSAKPYVDAGKPALNAEYPSEWRGGTAYSKDTVCATSRAAGVMTILARLDLDRVTDRC